MSDWAIFACGDDCHLFDSCNICTLNESYIITGYAGSLFVIIGFKIAILSIYVYQMSYHQKSICALFSIVKLILNIYTINGKMASLTALIGVRANLHVSLPTKMTIRLEILKKQNKTKHCHVYIVQLVAIVTKVKELLKVSQSATGPQPVWDKIRG